MLNNVILIGRMTKDVELRMTPNGKAVTNFSIAVNRIFNGEQTADFFDCVAWGKTAENMEKYTKKGSQIAVKGSLQTRSYESNGRNVKAVEVLTESVQFLDSKPQNEQSNFGRTAAQSMYAQSQANSYDPFQNMNGKLDISESDLPF